MSLHPPTRPPTHRYSSGSSVGRSLMSQAAPRSCFRKKGASGSSTRMPAERGKGQVRGGARREACMRSSCATAEASSAHHCNVRPPTLAPPPCTLRRGRSMQQGPPPDGCAFPCRHPPSYIALPSTWPRNSIKRRALPMTSCSETGGSARRARWTSGRRQADRTYNQGQQVPPTLVCAATAGPRRRRLHV